MKTWLLSIVSKLKVSDVWLWLALSGGAVVDFVHISVHSIWYDEAFSWMLSQRSPSQIWLTDIRDVHPPLYYLVLHFWTKLWGTSELAMRSLSALFMLAAIVAAYFLIRRLFGLWPARVAALFVAFGPYTVRYAQEARMYSMLTFLLLLSSFYLVRAVQEKRRRDWIYYALISAVAFYTHYFSALGAGAQLFYLLAATLHGREWLSPKKLWAATWRWLAAMVTAAVLYLPWLPNVYLQFTRVNNNFWIPMPPPDALARNFAQFIAFNDLEISTSSGHVWFMSDFAFSVLWHFVALALIVAGIVWLYWRNRGHRAALTVLVSPIFLIPLLAYVWSFHRPTYLYRYFIFPAVAFYCLLAVVPFLKFGRQWQMSKRQIMIYAVVVLALFGWGIRGVYRGDSSTIAMRDTAAHISANYRPGDVIISAQLYTYFNLSYYTQRDHLPNPKLLNSGENYEGWGVTSLIYKNLPAVMVQNYGVVRPASGYAWIVVQDTSNEYLTTKLPSNWQPAGPRYNNLGIDVQRFKVNP